MASPLRRALSSGSSSAPARPSRLSHEVHFDPSSSSSDDEPDDTQASDADTSDNDEGEDDVCELPAVTPVAHHHGHHAGQGHARSSGVAHPVHGRGGGTSSASRSLRVAHLSSGLSHHSASADADDDDGNSEYTDTDDDDYQAPQLPLTDSRGERILDATGSSTLPLAGPSIRSPASEFGGLMHPPSSIPHHGNPVQHHERTPVTSSDPWAAYDRRHASSSSTPHDSRDVDADSPITHFNRHIQAYEPVPWERYFAGGCIDVPGIPSVRNSNSTVPGLSVVPQPGASAGTFRVYWTASADLLAIAPKGTIPQSPETLFVFVHGAGQGALSFATCASLLADIMPNCVVLAADLRGHGHTTVAENVPLTRSQYSSDLTTVLHHLFPGMTSTGTEAGLPLPHDVVLVGHSLGGAIAAQLASTKPCPIPHMLGLAILDVVEGTALDALLGMRSLIAKWPSRFDSVEAAIRWAVECGQVSNPSSACVSVPAQVVPIGDGPAVRWRTDLLSTEPFWEDWYKGLSSMFLSSPVAKLLVLAGTDRLDRELTIGQMQGKFQMEVMQNVGHNLQEDAPSAFAHVMAGFAKRNARLILPPKFHPAPPISSTTAHTQPVTGMFAVAPAALNGKSPIGHGPVESSLVPPLSMGLGTVGNSGGTTLLPARLPPR